MSMILVYQGWQQRNKMLPLIPISEATRHDGERVRIRGAIRSAEETPQIDFLAGAPEADLPRFPPTCDRKLSPRGGEARRWHRK